MALGKADLSSECALLRKAYDTAWKEGTADCPRDDIVLKLDSIFLDLSTTPRGSKCLFKTCQAKKKGRVESRIIELNTTIALSLSIC